MIRIRVKLIVIIIHFVSLVPNPINVIAKTSKSKALQRSYNES